MADSLNMTGVKDLPEQVVILQDFGIWPVLINFLTCTDKFCPVIVEMCSLYTDYYSGTKKL